MDDGVVNVLMMFVDGEVQLVMMHLIDCVCAQAITAHIPFISEKPRNTIETHTK